MNMNRLARTVALLLALAACRETGGENELFEISGKLFVFNYRMAEATYLVTLKPLQPMRDGQTAVATFEDPVDGGAIVVRQKIWPSLDKVTIESPPLSCVAKGKPYSVSIAIEGGDGATLQTLKTTITSSEDQSRLPDAPLVVGPAYTPNPELAGNPAGKRPGEARPCPS
ncbi:MAG TPA: hypothetical protein VNS34_07465 [Rhizobiaceae bacterium]|nr:hypothetical protein [Rhizobiaceae bacterium]